MIRETRTLTVTVDAPMSIVAADLADPATHPEWATEFFAGPAEPDGNGLYVVSVPALGGDAHVKVEALPERGVIDMFFAPKGAPFGDPTPVRVIPNADGADVLWTMTRHPGMPDDVWAAALESVQRELGVLKRRLEAGVTP